MMLIVASIVLASIIIVLLGLLLGQRFVKGITLPLTRLVASSGELAGGNYNQISSAPAGTRSVNWPPAGNMAQTVKQHIDTLSESEREAASGLVDLEISNRLLGMAMNSRWAALNESLEDKVLHRTAELEAANRKLSELTVTDALTGLANRRRFDAVIADEWSRAARTGQALAVIMLDIDFYFKRYNDGYGHQAGDACLRQVANVLQSSVQRPGDLVARYGGEEFVVVATDADLTTARELAENMRRSVEALAIPHDYSPTASGSDLEPGVGGDECGR